MGDANTLESDLPTVFIGVVKQVQQGREGTSALFRLFHSSDFHERMICERQAVLVFDYCEETPWL